MKLRQYSCQYYMIPWKHPARGQQDENMQIWRHFLNSVVPGTVFFCFIHLPFAVTIRRCWTDTLNVILQCRSTLWQLINTFTHREFLSRQLVTEILFKSQNYVILLGTKRPQKSASIFLHWESGNLCHPLISNRLLEYLVWFCKWNIW